MGRPLRVLRNITRRRGGPVWPPGVLAVLYRRARALPLPGDFNTAQCSVVCPLISLASLDSFPPKGGKPVKRTPKAFPTQGGRWPAGPDEGTFVVRRVVAPYSGPPHGAAPTVAGLLRGPHWVRCRNSVGQGLCPCRIGPMRPTPPVRGRWPEARGGRDHRALQKQRHTQWAPTKARGSCGALP